MVNGVVVRRGGIGDKVFPVNLVFGKFRNVFVSTSMVDRVPRNFGDWRLEGRRRCGRKPIGSGDRRIEFEGVLGVGFRSCSCDR